MEPNALERAFARTDARLVHMTEDLERLMDIREDLSVKKLVEKDRDISSELSKRIRKIMDDIHDLEIRIRGFQEGIYFFDKYYDEEMERDSEAKRAATRAGKPRGYIEKVADRSH